MGSFSVNRNKNEKFLELLEVAYARPPMHASTRCKGIFVGRPAPMEGREPTSDVVPAAFSHGKHGKLEKGGGERGERSRRGAHVMAMRPFSASAAGPRLPAIHQPLAVTALHAHHEHFQRAHSAARRKLKFN
jgi:hypothetical protein